MAGSNSPRRLTSRNFITAAVTIESSHLGRHGSTMIQNLLNKKLPLPSLRNVLPSFYLEMSHCTVPVALQETPGEAAESQVYLRAVFSMPAFTVNNANSVQERSSCKVARSDIQHNKCETDF